MKTIKMTKAEQKAYNKTLELAKAKNIGTFKIRQEAADVVAEAKAKSIEENNNIDDYKDFIDEVLQDEEHQDLFHFMSYYNRYFTLNLKEYLSVKDYEELKSNIDQDLLSDYVYFDEFKAVINETFKKLLKRYVKAVY